MSELGGHDTEEDAAFHTLSGHTPIQRLREVYGENFAKGYAPTTTLGELLANEGCETLFEYMYRCE